MKEMPDNIILQELARQARATTIQMAHDGRESHLTGALSCTDILIALFHGFLNMNSGQDSRDRFIFSKGHACASYYAVMAQCGLIPVDYIKDYATNDCHLPSHPCKHALPVLDCSSGSLGHGLGVGAGMAYARKLEEKSGKVVVLISDGECNEGSTWEAATFARAHNLDNLLCIVDNNGTQAVGQAEELNGYEPIENKYESFGWASRVVNGNDIAEIKCALSQVPFKKGMPSVIVAKTVSGKGISFMENQLFWNYRVPSDEDLNAALEELGVRPIHMN